MSKRKTPAPPAFHVMIKPRGPICNLNCAYCYYLSKEKLYPGSQFRMTDEVLESFTRQYIEAQRVPEVTFGWQGGEPLLMGIDFFQRAVELQQKYCRPGMRIINAFQTNGTLLNDEWCRFFQQHHFLIGLSVDGPQQLHDAYRVDKAGQPWFDRVMAGVDFLKKHQVEWNILACVHAANAAYPLEVYRFFRDEIGAQFIQFIPIVRRDNTSGFQEGNKVTDYSVTGKQYGEFLIAIFDEWVRRDVGRVFVQIFDIALGAWLGQQPALCIFSETCGTALALEHNGDLFACDHFVEPRYKLGNIQKKPLIKLVSSSQQRKFGTAKRDILPAYCQKCDVHFVCHGGCPKNRILRTPDGQSGLNYLCEGYKAFFRHIDRPMQVMASTVRSGRPASNIMRWIARQ